MMDYEKIFKAMTEYFAKYGKTKSVEYCYGYFDCVYVIRMIQEGRNDE